MVKILDPLLVIEFKLFDKVNVVVGIVVLVSLLLINILAASLTAAAAFTVLGLGELFAKRLLTIVFILWFVLLPGIKVVADLIDAFVVALIVEFILRLGILNEGRLTTDDAVVVLLVVLASKIGLNCVVGVVGVLFVFELV